MITLNPQKDPTETPKMNKRHLLRATAMCAAALCLATQAPAQDFPPKKPVTLVVGFAAGGAAMRRRA